MTYVMHELPSVTAGRMLLSSHAVLFVISSYASGQTSQYEFDDVYELPTARAKHAFFDLMLVRQLTAVAVFGRTVMM